MSYVVPFQGLWLFEDTFKRQINSKTGVVETRKYIFDRHFGEGEDKIPVVPDRYRLIWMAGCPYSNKAVITLRLLGLDRVISVGECGVLRDPRGWVFSEDIGEVDPVLKIHYLDDAYLKADPEFTGRSTVPAVIDIESGKVVENDPTNLPKYFVTEWKQYHKENAPDLYPERYREEIDEWSDYINREVDAYRCGFAREQEVYDRGYDRFFEALDTLDDRLKDRRFINGDYISLSDLHLYVALIRFHINYHLVFGVNKKRLQDYENLWGYVRDIFGIQTFREYTKLEWIKRHYQLSPHMRAKLGNVQGLMGVGPDDSQLYVPSNRDRLSADPENVFTYEEEIRPEFLHKDDKTEKEYIDNYIIYPIRKASVSKDQNELNRWAYLLRDAFTEIDHRLGKSRYLLGDEIHEADELLYRTIIRYDHIYYYLYKLNLFKSFDFKNIGRYTDELGKIDRIRESIDIQREKEKAFGELDDDRNPYHLVFKGPESR